MDGDCEDCGETLSGGGEDRSAADKRPIFVADQMLVADQTILMPIRVAAIAGLRHYGLELLLDASLVELLAIEQGELYEEIPVFGRVDDDAGVISVRYSWDAGFAGSRDVPEGAVLFYLHLRARRDIASLRQALRQSSTRRHDWLRTASDSALMGFDLEIRNGAGTNAFKAELLGANPTSAGGRIAVTLPAPADVSIVLLDSKGQAIFKQTYSLSTGISMLSLPDTPRSPGLSTALVHSPFGCRTLRIASF